MLHVLHDCFGMVLNNALQKAKKGSTFLYVTGTATAENLSCDLWLQRAYQLMSYGAIRNFLTTRSILRSLDIIIASDRYWLVFTQFCEQLHFEIQ